jgi:hypothetical protein
VLTFLIQQVQVSFGMMESCEKFNDNVIDTPDYAKQMADSAEMRAFLTNRTGLNIDGLNAFQSAVGNIRTRVRFVIKMCLQFVVQAGLKDALPLPDWARNASFLKQMIDLHSEIHRHFIDIPMILEKTGGKLIR